MTARVYVTLKKSVLDPQGKAVAQGLARLGFGEVADVRVGKYIELTVDEKDPERARAASRTCAKSSSRIRSSRVPAGRGVVCLRWAWAVMAASVDPREAARTLIRRHQAEERRAEERASGLRERLPEAARLLREMGARGLAVRHARLGRLPCAQRRRSGGRGSPSRGLGPSRCRRGGRSGRDGRLGALRRSTTLSATASAPKGAHRWRPLSAAGARLRRLAEVAVERVSLGRIAADVEAREEDRMCGAACSRCSPWTSMATTRAPNQSSSVSRVTWTATCAGRRVAQGAARAHNIEILAVRPTLVSAEATAEFRELLRLRHFVRRAYVVEFDARRVLEHADRLLRLHPIFARDLDAFVAFLAATADAARSGVSSSR